MPDSKIDTSIIDYFNTAKINYFNSIKTSNFDDCIENTDEKTALFKQTLIKYIKNIEELRKYNDVSNLELEKNSLISETTSVRGTSIKIDDFERFYKNFSNIVTLTSMDDIFESGIISKTSGEILSLFNNNPNFTKKSIQKMFNDMFDNQQVIIGLLDGIAYIDYNIAREELPIIATAALSHEDDIVVEYGIRCFEKWRNKDSLRILKKLKCREEWMNIYVSEIVIELESELT